MKKPWQIWAAFGLCFAVVLIGMTWLTIRAVDLDHAEWEARQVAEEARRHAELQERIAMALWRMDWTMAPLIAQEVTRPSYAYQPFLKAPAGKEGKGQRWELASPLLTQPSNLVMVNFDVSPENTWTSPQDPSQVDMPDVMAAGVAPETTAKYGERLRELSGTVTYRQLLTQLPETLLPPNNPLAPASDPADAERSPHGVAANGDQAGQESVQQLLSQQPMTQSQQGVRQRPVPCATSGTGSPARFLRSATNGQRSGRPKSGFCRMGAPQFGSPERRPQPAGTTAVEFPLSARQVIRYVKESVVLSGSDPS